MRNNGQADNVLLTFIWRLAGQVLLDVPEYPVQVAKSVYTLMGKDPPEHLLTSLVGQQASGAHCKGSAGIQSYSSDQ